MVVLKSDSLCTRKKCCDILELLKKIKLNFFHLLIFDNYILSVALNAPPAVAHQVF